MMELGSCPHPELRPTRVSFGKAVLISLASSILIYKDWVYRNGFKRHSYKTSLLIEFFKRRTKPETTVSLCHLSVWTSWVPVALVSGRSAASEGDALSLLTKVWRQTIPVWWLQCVGHVYKKKIQLGSSFSYLKFSPCLQAILQMQSRVNSENILQRSAINSDSQEAVGKELAMQAWGPVFRWPEGTKARFCGDFIVLTWGKERQARKSSSRSSRKLPQNIFATINL